MVYLIKFFQVVAILFLAFFWNKFLLEKVFLILTKTYTKNSNDTFIPFFSIKDEKTIVKYYQIFYWLLAIVVSFLLVIQ